MSIMNKTNNYNTKNIGTNGVAIYCASHYEHIEMIDIKKNNGTSYTISCKVTEVPLAMNFIVTQ